MAQTYEQEKASRKARASAMKLEWVDKLGAAIDRGSLTPAEYEDMRVMARDVIGLAPEAITDGDVEVLFELARAGAGKQG